MKVRNSLWLASSLVAVVAGTQAVAQDVSAVNGAPAEQSGQALSGPPAGSSPAASVPPAENRNTTASTTENADIVVTGSRISRAGYSAPTPVQAVQTEDLIKRQPSTLADALYQLPAFQNSINANQYQATQANRQRTGNYLNLRALGTQRVLVLQDGQRLPPTGTNGGVDASLVPQLLTERVDVVTGGASAAYGSDAVSGVVNFIINKHFEGLKTQTQRGISAGGFGGSYRLGVAAGTALLDDRLHLIASAEHYHSDEVLRSSIPSVGESILYLGAGTAASPFYYQGNLRRSTESAGGLILTGPLAGQQFARGGVIVPYNRGQPTNTPGLQIGGDGGYFGQDCCTITPSQTQTQLFGRAEYDFTDTMSAFVSAGYNFSDNRDYATQFATSPTTIYRDNAFLSPSAVAAMGTSASFTLGKNDASAAPLYNTQTSNSTLVNAGVKGELGADLKWQAGYTYGRTFFRTKLFDVDMQRYYAGIDAVRGPGGNIVCRASLTAPGLYPGCVPVDLFGAGSISQEAKDYIFTQSTYSAVNRLNSGQVSLSGTLFDNWAGPVSFAVGGEIRHQSLRQVSNSNPAEPVDFTGLRGVPSSTLKYRVLNVGEADGDYTVKEAFAELDLPLLKNSAIGSLSANGAVRLTDYSTSGSVTTWKVGGLYDPIPGIRLRGTYSRDIRAPTLYELFAGRSSFQLRVSDTLTGQEGLVQQITGGNQNLTPEIAKTFTGGLVIGPQLIRGLSFSVDYFDIQISQAIATPYSVLQVIDLCAASNYTSQACSFISRPLGPTNPDPANFPTSVLTLNENLATVGTRGIDFNLSYKLPVAGGQLTFDAAATRLLSYTQRNSPEAAKLEFAGTADLNDGAQPVPLPKWRGTFGVTAEFEPVTLFIQERIVGALDRSHLLEYRPNRIGAVAYTDASLIFDVHQGDRKFQFFATANNLFNRKPPVLPTNRSPGQTVPTIRTAYDIVGTYVTVGVRTSL